MSDNKNVITECARAAAAAAQEAMSFKDALGEISDGAGEDKLALELARANDALRRLARKLEKRASQGELKP